MDFNLSQSLQLKQSLKLNQHLIQRFNILEQSLDQFETSMEDQRRRRTRIFLLSGFRQAPLRVILMVMIMLVLWILQHTMNHCFQN